MLEVERLDDDLALEATEAGRARQIHLPHPAGREMVQDLVSPDSLNAEQRVAPVKARSPYTRTRDLASTR